MAKALGSDINDFYNNHFPEDCYCDEMYDTILSLFKEDDSGVYKLSLDPTTKYDLDCFGVIIKHDDSECWDFEVLYKKWKKSCEYKSFFFKVKYSDKELLEKIEGLLNTYNIKNDG